MWIMLIPSALSCSPWLRDSRTSHRVLWTLSHPACFPVGQLLGCHTFIIGFDRVALGRGRGEGSTVVQSVSQELSLLTLNPEDSTWRGKTTLQSFPWDLLLSLPTRSWSVLKGTGFPEHQPRGRSSRRPRWPFDLTLGLAPLRWPQYEGRYKKEWK